MEEKASKKPKIEKIWDAYRDLSHVIDNLEYLNLVIQGQESPNEVPEKGTYPCLAATMEILPNNLIELAERIAKAIDTLRAALL